MAYCRIFFTCILYFCLVSISRGADLWDQLLPSYKVEDLGNCEFFEEKDYNEELINVYSDLNFQIDHKLLQTGKVQFACETLNPKEFKEKIPIEVLSNSENFEKGLIIVQKGAFIVNNKSKKFYSPDYQLDRDVVETIGRKVKVIKKISKYGVHAQKQVKHSLKVIPQIHLNVFFRSYTYAYSKQRFRGDLSEKVCPVQMSQLADEFLQRDDALKPRYLFAVYGQGDQKILRGIYFVSMSYPIPNSDKSLIITWQIASIRSNFVIKTGLKLIPKLIHKTVMRDFARYVDVMRTLDPSK